MLVIFRRKNLKKVGKLRTPWKIMSMKITSTGLLRTKLLFFSLGQSAQCIVNKEGHWGHATQGVTSYLARYENMVGACGPTEHRRKIYESDFLWWCQKGTEGHWCLWDAHPENCMRDRMLYQSHGTSLSGIGADSRVCGSSFVLMILGKSLKLSFKIE